MEGHPTRQIPMWPLTFRMYKELLLNTKKKKNKNKNKKQKTINGLMKLFLDETQSIITSYQKF
jgi:hypothetical protein